MLDALWPLLVKTALYFARNWLDARASTWGASGPTDERLKALEDEAFALLEKVAESDAGKKFLRAVIRNLIHAHFSNDPTTWAWG